MLRPTLADERLVSNPITELIARFRFILFGILILLYAISFNGQWRPGQDSAIYRGLAANLAEGKGYVFGEWATQQVYPGLPLLLAGIQKVMHVPIDDLRAAGALVFVDRRIDTIVSILAIQAMALLTLVVTYRLIRLHYPVWMAVCVTFGVGINSWFLQLSNELLTDVPFLFGVVVALYGWELLQSALTRAASARALLLIVIGLALAGSMRPMFWVVGVSWILVCGWALIRGDRRRFHSVTLIVLLVTWALLIVLDPRHQAGMEPFSATYERELHQVLPDSPQSIQRRLHEALRNELPAAFFGEQMAPLSIVASLVLLGSCLLLFRRHTMWACMIFVAFAVTVLVSTTARYYIMVLPMMLLGWLLMLLAIVRRLPHRWGTVVLFLGLALVTCNNLTAAIGFIREQRSRPFLAHYKGGKYVQLLKMCDVVRQQVSEQDRVLGPLASLMSYVSGRTVLSQREVLAGGPVPAYPQLMADAQIGYAVFPGRAYRAKEPYISKLMEKNVIYPAKKLAWVDDWYLARIRVRVPRVPDWRDLPKGWTPPQPSTRPARKPPSTAATQPKKKPATRPTTRPTTRSTTRPTTRPAKKPSTRATTRPTTRPATRPATPPSTTRSASLDRMDQVRLAISTMLSPRWLAASGAEASALRSHGIPAPAALAARLSKSSPLPSDPMLLSRKYPRAATPSSPIALSALAIVSRIERDCGWLW
jgi:hypothetical protein